MCISSFISTAQWFNPVHNEKRMGISRHQLRHLAVPSLFYYPLDCFSRTVCPSGYLGPDEEYVLVPSTYGEGKLGAFVVSVTSTSEFSFVVEKK